MQDFFGHDKVETIQYFNLSVESFFFFFFLTDWVVFLLSCEMQSTFLSDWIISMENKAEREREREKERVGRRRCW